MADEELNLNAEQLISRVALAAKLGSQYDGDRDLYESYGYKNNLQYEDFLRKYRRQDIARAVIDKPVTATWKGQPEIVSEDNEQLAEQANELLNDIDFWHYASRADTLASIGHYSCILLGLPGDFDEEATEGPIEYVTAYSEQNCELKRIKTANDPDFGEPASYELDPGGDNLVGLEGAAVEKKVHASRVIHVANDLLENDLKGMPALLPIYNRLDDLEKIVGSSAEAFWSEIKPTLQADIDKDANITSEQIDELDEKFQELLHGLRRAIQTKGVDLNKISADLNSPSDPFDIIISLISGSEGIPKRLLLGSERGDLASSQDEATFYEMIEERRENFAEAKIVRPVVKRLQSLGILTEGSFDVEWPNLFSLNELEEAEVAQKKSKAMVQVSPAGDPSMTFTEEERREAAGFPGEIPTENADFMREEDEQHQEEVEQWENLQEAEGKRWPEKLAEWLTKEI